MMGYEHKLEKDCKSVLKIDGFSQGEGHKGKNEEAKQSVIMG